MILHLFYVRGYEVRKPFKGMFKVNSILLGAV